MNINIKKTRLKSANPYASIRKKANNAPRPASSKNVRIGGLDDHMRTLTMITNDS
jgi:hypothetical protein